MRPALIITAVLSGIIALAFGLAAMFLAVAEYYNPIIAALSVAVLLAAIAIMALVTDHILARRNPKPDMSSPTAMVKSAVRANPIGAVSALAALNFLIARQPAMAARMARHISTLVL
ncbi:MAG: hypothetical protein DHS20C06_07970 [Hyphobacterium sp.]|nr:MAG: hypothetical protein DHS20C06_07970 [Hyphobacterium sp.]